MAPTKTPSKIHLYGESRQQEFWSRIVVQDNGCWEYRPENKNLYSQIVIEGATFGTHRIGWELFNGPQPLGTVLDHLCENPKCVRHDHLEVVTDEVNLKRSGRTKAGQHSRNGLCPKGHEYSHTQAYGKNGRSQRVCRTCKAEWARNKRTETQS